MELHMYMYLVRMSFRKVGAADPITGCRLKALQLQVTTVGHNLMWRWKAQIAE